MPCFLNSVTCSCGLLPAVSTILMPAVDDGLAVFRVGRRLDRGQDGQVDAERLVGHVAAARDFLGELLRRRLRQRGDQAERAGIGDGRDQLGAADPLHAALDDRVFDANKLGESRLHVCPLVSMSIFQLEDALSCHFSPAGRPRTSFVRFRGAGCRHPPQKSTGGRRRSGQRHHAKEGLCFRWADNPAESPGLSEIIR